MAFILDVFCSCLKSLCLLFEIMLHTLLLILYVVYGNHIVVTVIFDTLIFTAAITVAYCPIGDFDCRGTNASSQTTPQCVMFSWVCDGEADCDNGLDEQMCSMFVVYVYYCYCKPHCVFY